MAKALADWTAAEVEALEVKLEKAGSTPAGALPAGLDGNGVNVPTNRHISGAMAKSSKRFSLVNYLVNGLFRDDTEKAKFEMDTMGRFRKSINDTRTGIIGSTPSSHWLPWSFDQMPDVVFENEDGQYCKSVMGAAGGSFDPEEADWLVRKGVVGADVVRKAQSAYFDATGGTLVAPPTMGELIPLVRPQAALLKAGVTTMALPPSGRYVRPRITSATTAKGTGEGQTTGQSTVGTNEMVMQAKKITGAATISEEATNFTSGTMDNIVQADLALTFALKLDSYGYYGPGGTELPAGITSSAYMSTIQNASAGINVVVDFPTAVGIGPNGNTLVPEYGDRMPTLIEERSFGADEEGAWIIRPAALSRARSDRADAVTAGDGHGPYVDILKTFAQGPPKQWAGRRVITTTNLKNTLTKGTASDLSDAFYGIWKYMVLGTYGAVQFAKGHDGNTFLNGQYIIRGTLFGDWGFLYPQAFLWYTQVLGASGLLDS